MKTYVFFVLNLVLTCAMFTFAPALAFALANSTDVNGKMIWPVVLPGFKFTI